MINPCNYHVRSCLTSKLKDSLTETWSLLEIISLLAAWVFTFETSEVCSCSTDPLHVTLYFLPYWNSGLCPEGVLLLQKILGKLVRLILYTFRFLHRNAYSFLQIQLA